MLKYSFVRVYFDMSPNFSRNIPSDMDQIFWIFLLTLVHMFVLLFTLTK
jgi:hypothetical protein